MLLYLYLLQQGDEIPSGEEVLPVRRSPTYEGQSPDKGEEIKGARETS